MDIINWVSPLKSRYWISLAATSPSFVFANLVLFNALRASSCPIRHVPVESARSAGEISMALKLSTL